MKDKERVRGREGGREREKNMLKKGKKGIIMSQRSKDGLAL